VSAPAAPARDLEAALGEGDRLERECARALAGARGAFFTPFSEARLLAAAGLAHAAARRGGPPADVALDALLAGEPRPGLAAALDGLSVLDPACGAGALLVAAHVLARRAGARLVLHGIELAPLAVRAARARLALLGARARIRPGDALALPWPAAGLVLANPPFLRHEALAPAEKRAAARASGLPAGADLSAHFAAVAIRRAPVAALVWPRALDVSRSASRLVADAGARGGFVLRLRSRIAGSFAASVDTVLAVWALGAADAAPAEASVPLGELGARDLAALARGSSTPRVRIPRAPARAPAASVPLVSVCDVRFGTKTGCNGFFHLAPAGADRLRSALLDRELSLAGDDTVPLLASLREASAPSLAAPARRLFRPPPGRPSEGARAYVLAGEAAGVHLRPTCRQRETWWRLAPGRGPAPLLYPAKVGARAFAFLNDAGLWEDKKWHALWPRDGVEAWILALVLSATPVRLAVDLRARQLTGAQAIADVDTGVLAAAPVPSRNTLAALARELGPLRGAILATPVTTDLAGMLARPAQRALDDAVGRAMGLAPAEIRRASRAMRERVESRLAHAASIRRRQAGGGRGWPSPSTHTG